MLSLPPPATPHIVRSHSVPPMTADSASTRNGKLLPTLLGHARLHWLWTGSGGSRPARHLLYPKKLVSPAAQPSGGQYRAVGTSAWFAASFSWRLGPPGEQFLPSAHTRFNPNPLFHRRCATSSPNLAHFGNGVRSWLGDFLWLPEQFEQEKQHRPSRAEQSLRPGPSRLLVGSAPTCLSLGAFALWDGVMPWALESARATLVLQT